MAVPAGGMGTAAHSAATHGSNSGYNVASCIVLQGKGGLRSVRHALLNRGRRIGWACGRRVTSVGVPQSPFPWTRRTGRVSAALLECVGRSEISEAPAHIRVTQTIAADEARAVVGVRQDAVHEVLHAQCQPYRLEAGV